MGPVSPTHSPRNECGKIPEYIRPANTRARPCGRSGCAGHHFPPAPLLSKYLLYYSFSCYNHVGRDMPEFAVPKPPHPPPLPAGSNLEPHDVGQYAELDVVTNFSFLRGASHPDELVYRATELGYKAIAITDINSLAGVVRAFDATKQVIEQGGRPPKLIVGTRLTFTDGTPDLLVYVTDRPAYARLCRLLTLGKRRTEKGQCSLTLADFLDHNEGLLAAICPISADISQNALHLLREALGPTDRLSLANNCLHGADDVARLEELNE